MPSIYIYACTGAKAGSISGVGPQPHQAVVTVLFGTEYGFSKEIAQKLAAQLSASHDFWQALSSAHKTSVISAALSRAQLQGALKMVQPGHRVQRAAMSLLPFEGRTPCICRPRLLDMADLPGGLPGLASEQAVLVVCSTQVSSTHANCTGNTSLAYHSTGTCACA